MMIRAGVDDRAMLSMTGVNVRLLFVGVFAIGGMLAGFSGVIGGSALSVVPARTYAICSPRSSSSSSAAWARSPAPRSARC